MISIFPNSKTSTSNYFFKKSTNKSGTTVMAHGQQSQDDIEFKATLVYEVS